MGCPVINMNGKSNPIQSNHGKLASVRAAPTEHPCMASGVNRYSKTRLHVGDCFRCWPEIGCSSDVERFATHKVASGS